MSGQESGVGGRGSIFHKAPSSSLLLHFLLPYRWRILAAMACVGGGIFVTMQLIPLSHQLTDIFNHLSYGRLNYLAFMAVLIYVGKGIFTYGQLYLMSYVSLRTITDLRQALYRHVLRQSHDFFQRERTVDIASRLINDVNALRDGIRVLLADFIPSAFLVAALLGYLVYLNWRLTLITMIAVPSVAWAVSFFATRIQRIAERVQAQVSDIFTKVHETLTGISVVKAFARESQEMIEFTSKNERNFHYSLRSARIAALQPPIVALIQTAATAGVIWMGGYEIMNARLTPADLISYVTAILLAIDPTIAITNASMTFNAALGALNRVQELLAHEPSIQQAPDAQPLRISRAVIRLDNVTFRYPGQQVPVFQGLALEFPSHALVALVGPTGGGKSTLFNLLLRFYDPDGGAICIDGQDLRTVQLASLHQLVAYIPQNPTLFTGTVRDNIAFGCPDATDEDIMNAARTAKANDFIQALPQGYDTAVGERGNQLSGGQQQRLAIARALVYDPQVLLMDEATSALDLETEAQMQEALEAARQGRTTVIIAHRLTTVQRADIIFVIDEGRLVENGSHSQLVKRGGLYAQLYQRQLQPSGAM